MSALLDQTLDASPCRSRVLLLGRPLRPCYVLLALSCCAPEPSSILLLLLSALLPLGKLFRSLSCSCLFVVVGIHGVAGSAVGSAPPDAGRIVGAPRPPWVKWYVCQSVYASDTRGRVGDLVLCIVGL